MKRTRKLREIVLPGSGFKRWLFVLLMGILQMAVGLLIWFRSAIDRVWESWPYQMLSLGYLPRFPRGLAFLGAGGLLTYLGWQRLTSALVRLIVPERADTGLTQLVMERQRAERGRRVVVIGGDPGLTPIIKALQLLEEDVRIDVVLSATEHGRLAQELQSKLNLSNERIIYPTEADAVLYAELEDGRLLEGATTINRYQGGRIKDLFLSRDIRRVQVWESENDGKGTKAKLRGYMPNVSERALEALAEAEIILFAPGHIYTQVLSNLTQPRFAQAVRESAASKVYVANLMTEPGRTDDWTVADHLAVIREMSGVAIDYVIVHQGSISEKMLTQYHNEGADVVR
ncbi:MAG: 2-phospho-L-lactate transferase CofD family protein, partial [Ardenticatenaceae bacterium]